MISDETWQYVDEWVNSASSFKILSSIPKLRSPEQLAAFFLRYLSTRIMEMGQGISRYEANKRFGITAHSLGTNIVDVIDMLQKDNLISVNYYKGNVILYPMAELQEILPPFGHDGGSLRTEQLNAMNEVALPPPRRRNVEAKVKLRKE